MNGTDFKFRSRKFIIAAGSLLVASALAAWGTFILANDTGDIALVLGAWGAVDGVILKLYNDANLLAGGKK